MSKEPNRNVYVGHRYVPKIMGEWDKQEDYEGLSIVTHQGNSYTSKKRVPVGIDISNDEFWVVTGNYNAQVEYYREDVNRYRNEVNDYKEDTDNTIDQYKKDTDNTIDDFKNEYNEITTNVKYFGAKGDGITDDTNAINEALQNHSNVYIPDGVYMINAEKESLGWESISQPGGIIVPSNRKLKLSKNAVLKAITTNKTGYSIINISNSENVTISGGKIIGERENHVGNEGEHGFGIQLHYSENIKLSDIYISKCWGDGIYIRGGDNIIGEYLISDYNRRQGLSIVEGRDMTFNHCKFINTEGTAPEAGVDLEQSTENITITDINFNDCIFTGNKGRGFVIPAIQDGSITTFINLNKCKIYGNDREEFRVHGNTHPDTLISDIYINNSFIDNVYKSGLIMSNLTVYVGSDINRTPIKNFKMENTIINGVTVMLSNCDKLFIKECVFNNENTINIENCNDLIFKENNIDGGTRGIDLTNGINNNLTIENNTIKNIQGYGIFSSEGFNFIINNNRLINISSNGIQVTSGSGHIIKSNIIKSIGSRAISLPNTDKAIIISNQAESNHEFPIFSNQTNIKEFNIEISLDD